MDNIKIKNVILKEYNPKPVGIAGLEIQNRRMENNENYQSLMGTKQQINQYLQDKNILSDRLRTLNNLPKYRLIGTECKRVEIY